MIGRFHEISIRTDDIRQSVEFYEQLGLSQCVAGETWSHPYGELKDGAITLGIHHDFAAMRAFWERLGFVAHAEEEVPYLRMSMTSDRLNIGAHRPRTLDAPMLVFAAADMPARIERLHQMQVDFSAELPRGLARGANALLTAPEGTQLLLLHELA